MIKSSSIDNIRSATDIVDVISARMTIKKNGASWVGCCPFHDEKTPSFRVFPATQTYKCFGCGASGDAIKFVMQNDKRSYPEALEELAKEYNILLEYETGADKEAWEKKQNEREKQKALLQYAYNKYEQLLWSLPDDAPVLQYLDGRGYTTERVKKWGLGLAPDDWKFLTTPLINKGKYADAKDAGLVRTNNGNNYDAYHNRIIIPLHNPYGDLVGLSGRIYLPEDAEKLKKVKYINPENGLLYNKSNYWYGLWQAQKEIKRLDYAILVEGYMDVHSMHDLGGFNNTIAACGTAITDEQVRLLKRYTSTVHFCFDGDPTGVKKTMASIDIFLKHHFRVGVYELPKDTDPDEFLKERAGTIELINDEV